MNKFIGHSYFLLAAGIIVVVCGGCSAQARKARAIERGNRYFAAGQYDAAEIDYLNALRIDQRSPEALGRLGVIYFDQGRMGKSLPFLLASRRLEPDNLEVRLYLGLYLLAYTNFKQARDEANYILDHDPSNPDAPLLLAEASVHPNEIEEAKTRLARLPASITAKAPVLVALGTLEFRQKHFLEAEPFFKRALAIDAGNSSAYTALGALYWAGNEIDEAGRAFAKAAELSSNRSSKKLQYAQFMLQTAGRDTGRKILIDLVHKAPDFLPASMLLAEIDEQGKQYDESAALVAAVLQRDPGYPDALLLSGRLWLAQGKPEEAVKVLENARSLYPTFPQVEYLLAQAYLAEGSNEKAAVDLGLAVSQAPDFVEAVLALVDIDTNKGDWDTVVGLLTPLVEKHPEVLRARYLLANAYIHRNEPTAAIGVLRQIAEATPKDPQPFLLTGMVLLQQNDRTDARKEFELALNLAPEFSSALEQLINLDLAERQLGPAKQRIEDRLTKKPASPDLHVLLARVYLAQKEFTLAEAELRKAIELKADSPRAYFLLAEMYFTTKQDGKALENLREVVAKNPKDIPALMLMATIEDQEKDYSASRDAYEKVLAADPDFGAALNNLAYLYSDKLDNLDKAFDLAQRARKVLPNEPNVADTLGWVLFKRHQYTWALGLLTESAGTLRTEPETQYHLGMVQYMLGDEAAARASFERALQAGRDFPDIDQMKDRLAVLAIDVKSASQAERAMLEKAASARPGDPVVLSRLVSIDLRDHQVDYAIAACERATAANPKDVVALTLLARLYFGKGEIAKGFELAKNAHNLAPSDPNVAAILGRLAFAMRDYRWSLSLLKDSVANRPNDPDAQFDLARALYSVGSTSDAEVAVRRALDSKTVFDRAAEAQGFQELVALSDDPAHALSEADRIDGILKTDPDNVPALMAAGEISELNGNATAAVGAYEKVLGHFPDFSPAERRLIILYSKESGNTTKGYELAPKAREAFPKDPEVAKACGIIDYQHGDYRRAEELLAESAARTNGDAETVYYLGMAQYRLKEKSSKSTLERALEMDLSTDLAAEVRRILTQIR